jgi:Protein of unknown function (DUF3558)
MTRRMLAGLALVLAGATACAEVVPGSGTLAPEARAGGGAVRSSSPSPTESSPASPSSSASGSPSKSESGGTSPVCESLDEAALESAFGTGVTLARSQSSGCRIEADDGRSMIVAVFDYLTLSEYKKPNSKELTVGGYPAIRATSTTVYVGRSMDPEAEGLLAAYFSGLRDGGETVTVKVLEQLIAKYHK